MEGILKSDIFFFITTIVVVVLGIGLAILIVYLIRIFRDVKDISKQVKKETEAIVADVSTARENIKSGAMLGRLAVFFKKISSKRKKGRKLSD